MTRTVLILGPSGKIGAHSARAFAAAGWTVRPYKRGTDMSAAAMGADVIVNGLNPPNYHDWARLIPAITTQIIAAARASGASVIIPGNVYNFGDRGGEWSETTPQRPVSRKGQIRVEMEQAYANSGVQTIVIRAGNFIDPDHDGDIMSLFLMRDIAKGRLTTGGDPDVMQTYCYVPDWARAAVALAEKRAELARFEDVPFPGHAFTMHELQTVVQDALGRPVRIAKFPWIVFRIASPFWELARELSEMRYLYSTPHTLSGTKLAGILPGFRTADLREVMLAGLLVEICPDKPVRSGQFDVGAQSGSVGIIGPGPNHA
jgi:nucleoside-diphosphate-sugar epimerase